MCRFCGQEFEMIKEMPISKPFYYRNLNFAPLICPRNLENRFGYFFIHICVVQNTYCLVRPLSGLIISFGYLHPNFNFKMVAFGGHIQWIWTEEVQLCSFIQCYVAEFRCHSTHFKRRVHYKKFYCHAVMLTVFTCIIVSR